MSLSAAPSWFVHTAKGREGPLSLEDVRARVSRGDLLPDDYAWCPGMPEWKRVRHVERLQPAYSQESPPTLLSSPRIAPEASFDFSLDQAGSVELETRTFLQSKTQDQSEQDEPVREEQVNQDNAPSRSLELELEQPSGDLKEDSTVQMSQQGLQQEDGGSAQPIFEHGPVVSAPLPSERKIKAQPLPLEYPQDPEPSPLPIDFDQLTSPAASEGSSKFLFKAIIWACISGALFYGVLLAFDQNSFFTKFLWDKWFSPFPPIHELNAQDYQRLKAAAVTPLEKAGPRISLAVFSAQPSTSTLFLGSNLPDGAGFEVLFQPLVTTIVGEPGKVQPLSLTVKKHLGRSLPFKVAPGYYLAYVLPVTQEPRSAAPWIDRLPAAAVGKVEIALPADRKPVLVRKLFLGGIPDLSYQTRLSDYTAVRRGMASAELDTLRDVSSKMESLLAADRKAGSALVVLKIPQARREAFDLFQTTWSRKFSEIDGIVKHSMPFFDRTRQSALAIRDMLQKLHDKYHELIHADFVASGHKRHNSSQLSSGAVNAASIQIDAQTLADEIHSKIGELNSRIDMDGKRLANPLIPLVEERLDPAPDPSDRPSP